MTVGKKQLSAAQGIEAACVLFQLNSRTEDIRRLVRNIFESAQLSPAWLEGEGLTRFCHEWRAFTHAVVTAGLMQHAPNNVLTGYLRQTGNLLRHAAAGAPQRTEEDAENLESFVDGPFARYMALLAQERQAQCPGLFCRRLAAEQTDCGVFPATDARVQARLAAAMALVISAVWDKLGEYEILPD